MSYAIAIDLGGTNISAGIVNNQYELICQTSIPTNAHRPWMDIVKDISYLAKQLWETCELPKADCTGIGVGSPGICDSTTGEVVYSNNLSWLNVPLGPTVTKLTGLPCHISNDANCAALGEVMAGAAKTVKTWYYLHLVQA